jgi:hypothetical protein
MVLNPQVFMATMKARTSFEDSDGVLLKSYADWATVIAPEMAELFYGYLGKDAEMNAVINAVEGRVHRLSQTFVDWFNEMFTGIDDWGDEYAERRWRIGLIHVRVGIGPQHVVPAMATVIAEVNKKLDAAGTSRDLKDAIHKICTIDLTFIEQAYIEVSTNAVLNETGWTENLFKRMIASSIK